MSRPRPEYKPADLVERFVHGRDVQVSIDLDSVTVTANLVTALVWATLRTRSDRTPARTLSIRGRCERQGLGTASTTWPILPVPLGGTSDHYLDAVLSCEVVEREVSGVALQVEFDDKPPRTGP